MTDQEFEQQLTDLMEGNSSEKKLKKRWKIWKSLKNWKNWRRKRKILTGAAGVFAVLLLVPMISGGGKSGAVPVKTETLTKSEIQEILSISGPISGTDSAEVVSRLHAEILEILVKEGDKVKAGQVLARLDPTDVQQEVDIAQNAYDLAVANMEDARIQAENGYAKAVQNEQATRFDHERKAALFAAGDISQVEMEAAQNAWNDAKRELRSYTLENGKAVASRSYSLQVKNAEFELEQKKKKLEETQVVSPIAGTVVRVNSRVGRFADTVDDDKPLFAIDNLEKLEMKISVSEYSIGSVKVGQEAEISADILNGELERGVITSISPTGEEKGGGSTERVIPTTIQIQNPDTKLIAGITARAKIVLNEAKDAWVVPVSAVMQRGDGTYLAAVEQDKLKLIPVETGVESDTSVEVKGEGLTEGLTYITAPDPVMAEGTPVMAVSLDNAQNH